MSDQNDDPKPDGDEESKERLDRAILERLRHTRPRIQDQQGPLSHIQPPEDNEPRVRLNRSTFPGKLSEQLDEDDTLQSLHQMRLDRMRQRMGSAAFEAYLQDHSEDQLLALENQLPPLSKPKVDTEKVRTRESSRVVNRVFFLVALFYGVLIGAGYPNWEIFTKGMKILESPLVFVGLIVIVVLLFLLFPNFVRLYDETSVYLWILILFVVVASAIGFVDNLVARGIIVLVVTGAGILFCYIMSMLVGRPVFRWIERNKLEKQAWIYGIVAVVAALVVLVAGWFGIDYLIKLLFP